MADKERNPWETEPDDEQELIPIEETDYRMKTHLVLEASESEEWGVVRDCAGNINVVPRDAPVVGNWTKYGEGTYWLTLTTSLEAMRDRSIRLTMELAEKRAAAPKPTTKPSKARKGAKASAAPEEPTELEVEAQQTLSTIDSLRSKLGR